MAAVRYKYRRRAAERVGSGGTGDGRFFTAKCVRDPMRRSNCEADWAPVFFRRRSAQHPANCQILRKRLDYLRRLLDMIAGLECRYTRDSGALLFQLRAIIIPILFMKNTPRVALYWLFTYPKIQGNFWLTAFLLQMLLAGSAVANVYPTNLRFNGAAANVFVSAVTNINISYILNEPATAGVVINIKSGETILRTISLTSPSAGTLRGTNVVVWDGQDGTGSNVGPGVFTITITASATGYDDWTQISDDNNLGNYVWEPRGIAVNKNANSPFYGRVFVANSSEGANPGNASGDTVGILKLNADGSPADESASFWNSTGGWDWAGQSVSPWKLESADDDRLYVNDLTNRIVLSFDQTISPASRRIVLNTNNYPTPNSILSGPFISGSGTNAQVWMADTTVGGMGIRRWQIGTNGVVATNDLGTTIVQSGSASDLNLAPYDVAVDRSNAIYTIQQRLSDSDAAYRVFRFPPYAGTVETTADWKIGNDDDTMEGASGVAVDPTGRYVAVSLLGNPQANNLNGAARVFNATNGAAVITLSPPASDDHTDVAWDNVGNLYTTDNLGSAWRTYSPPGTNQATTAAIVTVQIGTSPVLSGPSRFGGQFQFTLNGLANASYIIQTSTNLQTWVPVATNVSANAARTISVSAPAKLSFYRAVIGQ